MNNLSKIRAAFLLFLVFLGIAYAIPNFFNSSVKNTSFSFMPGKSINLGLDLKGGSYLLLKADMDIVFSEKLEILLSDIRSALRKSKIGYKKLSVNDEKISFQKRDPIPNDQIKSIILKIDENLILTIKESTFFIEFSDLNKKKIIKSTMAQAIEIVRRRIDETGTNEPSIQQQGIDRIIVQLPGLDDPSRIKNY